MKALYEINPEEAIIVQWVKYRIEYNISLHSARIINKRSCPFVYIEMGAPNNAQSACYVTRGILLLWLTDMINKVTVIP